MIKKIQTPINKSIGNQESKVDKIHETSLSTGFPIILTPLSSNNETIFAPWGENVVTTLPAVVVADTELPDIVASLIFPAFTDETKSEYANSVVTFWLFPFWNKLNSNNTTKIIVIQSRRFFVKLLKINPSINIF